MDRGIADRTRAGEARRLALGLPRERTENELDILYKQVTQDLRNAREHKQKVMHAVLFGSSSLGNVAAMDEDAGDAIKVPAVTRYKI